jgi:hypothetical protein
VNKLIDRMVHAFQAISPRTRVRAAAYLFILSVVGWPLTAFTLFRHEQQGILGLSWGAVILESLVLIVTTDIREEED